MLSLKPILPPVNLMPQWMSAYFSLAISVRMDFSVPFFALTSMGISAFAVLAKKSCSSVESPPLVLADVLPIVGNKLPLDVQRTLKGTLRNKFPHNSGHST